MARPPIAGGASLRTGVSQQKARTMGMLFNLATEERVLLRANHVFHQEALT